MMKKLIYVMISFSAVVLLLPLQSAGRIQNKSADQMQLKAALKDPSHKLWSESAPDTFRVKFETSKGAFVIEATRDWSPRGVDRFYNLTRTGFFDDSRLFRIRANYIAQFGIAGDPVIAKTWQNQAFPDDPVKQSNLRGYVAYAMTGPNTRTTQIYINLKDNTNLDAQGFSPIGKVVEVMDVVDGFYSEYGESSGGGMRTGKQGKMFEEGNAYLDREFPRLDKLISAKIVSRK
jgi:cyclophilin family peptidyl-prolyl cis-trans isomerase